ncbi:inositol-tetrakisphosphate 1-kinase [Syncephalis plumigaleata]|nr:inositol-tetrakisphosphate 1-kinase [Syncephalis plumigaleata]
MPIRRIGYILSPKKMKHTRFDTFNVVGQQYGMEFVPLDLNESFEKQGPFVAILNKVAHIILAKNRGDSQAEQTWNTIENLIQAYPSIPWIDSPYSTLALLSRETTLNHLMDQYRKQLPTPDFKIPPYVIVHPNNNKYKNSLKQLQFPVLCKPVLAAEAPESHHMHLIWSSMTSQFIDHDGVIIKVYVADDWFDIEARPSMANTESIAHSQRSNQKMPTQFGQATATTTPVTKDIINDLKVDVNLPDTIWQEKLQMIDRERVHRIAIAIGKALSMSLFGFDIVIDANNHHDYYVVDVNYFPSK